MDSIIEKNLLNIWALGKATSVIVARTLSSSAPPRMWSEYFRTSQRLSLQVEEVLVGASLGEFLDLSVPVVEGARVVQDTPSLAPWLTTPGSLVVYFVKGDVLVDLDIGVFPGDKETIERIRTICDGPMPTGVDAVFYTLCQMNESEPKIKAVFAELTPSVMDAFDDGCVTARLTVVKGVLRLFSGIRLERVIASRGPDLAVRATAAQWATVLTGRASLNQLDTTGEAPQLVSALNNAGRIIGEDEDLSLRLRTAAGA